MDQNESPLEGSLKDVPVVSEENLEKIIELNPDLIIGISSMKNQDKLKEIAPTVTYTYGKLGYLEQFIEIGKLLNKEEEAVAGVGRTLRSGPRKPASRSRRKSEKMPPSRSSKALKNRFMFTGTTGAAAPRSCTRRWD